MNEEDDAMSHRDFPGIPGTGAEEEKLVEEIARYIWGDHEDWEWAYAEARYIITRIGEACARGDVKLPGEVGRLEQEPQTRPYAHGVEQSLRGWILNRFKEGARTFIALNPGAQEEGG